MSNFLRGLRCFRSFNLPEWNIAVFSFLLYFVWEMEQMPFFQISPDLSCFDLVKNCSLATLGDVNISLTAFWTVAVMSRSRQWFHQPSRWQLGVYILVGVVITVLFEALATEVLHLWKYAKIMPIVPFLHTGLSPLLAWLLIPPLIIWFVQRQLNSVRQR